MAKRLFVGGLPYSVDNSKLEQMFSEVGIVSSAAVITDRETGQSKGFGFVEFEKDADADEAIKKLNDTEVDGRRIVVNVARPREERPRFDNRGGGGGGGRW
ncbi:MAG: RNA-binding protein [Patescibacteria group bacterium]